MAPAPRDGRSRGAIGRRASSANGAPHSSPAALHAPPDEHKVRKVVEEMGHHWKVGHRTNRRSFQWSRRRSGSASCRPGQRSLRQRASSLRQRLRRRARGCSRRRSGRRSSGTPSRPAGRRVGAGDAAAGAALPRRRARSRGSAGCGRRRCRRSYTPPKREERGARREGHDARRRPGQDRPQSPTRVRPPERPAYRGPVRIPCRSPAVQGNCVCLPCSESNTPTKKKKRSHTHESAVWQPFATLQGGPSPLTAATAAAAAPPPPPPPPPRCSVTKPRSSPATRLRRSRKLKGLLLTKYDSVCEAAAALGWAVIHPDEEEAGPSELHPSVAPRGSAPPPPQFTSDWNICWMDTSVSIERVMALAGCRSSTTSRGCSTSCGRRGRRATSTRCSRWWGRSTSSSRGRSCCPPTTPSSRRSLAARGGATRRSSSSRRRGARGGSCSRAASTTSTRTSRTSSSATSTSPTCSTAASTICASTSCCRR